MPQVECPGLKASWINDWLAAVGITVLDARLRLHWTEDAEPIAVLSADDGDPVAALVEAWPSKETLHDLPIAECWNGAGELRRKVPVETFVERARAVRGHAYSWTLSSTMTDLCVDEKGEVAHAPFDPAGPGTVKWLHRRLVKLHLTPSAARIRDSLAGRSTRIKDNGLGFDQSRIGSQSDKTSKWIDPVIEELAFFGLCILPVRGRGADKRLNRWANVRAIQRGWHTIKPGGDLCFHWPAWHAPLDLSGIDALMDAWKPETKRSWRLLGVHAAWRSRRYAPRGSADTTRAFGSVRL